MSVKMLKLSFKWIFALFTCLALFVVPIHAADTDSYYNNLDYYIRTFQVESVFHKNNTITQTETIRVHYKEPKHGIFQYISRTLQMKEDQYRVKVKDISVKETKYQLSQENGSYVIKIGDADQTVMGDKTYTIRYTMVLPKDYHANYDFMYYDIIGSGWQCPMQKVSFHVQFEKPLNQSEINRFKLYSGSSGALSNGANVAYQVNKNGVKGKISNLPSYYAITMYTKLRSNYFENAYQRLPILPWIFTILALILFIFILFREFQSKVDKVVPIVTFQPPAGMDPAAVGYIVDGSADNVDLMALIPYWAQKGYVTLEDKTVKKNKPKIIVHQVVEIFPEPDQYQSMLFDALFGKGKDCDLSKLDETFGEQFSAAKEAIRQSFQQTQRISDSDPVQYLSIVGIVVFALGIMTSSYMGYFYHVLLAICLVIMYLVCWICLHKSVKQTFDNSGVGPIRIILSLVPFLIWLASLYGFGTGSDQIIPMPLWFVVSILAYATLFFLYRLQKMSDYWKNIAGPLMGLKDFIEKAEVDQLEKLSQENPSYFYDVIPYAMVFGLSKTWVKKFTNIHIPQPDWYTSDSMTVWSPMYFYSAMDSGLESPIGSAISSYNASVSASSGGGAGGGGAGGGGGGAW